jgi:hypothetical protein
MSVNDNEIFTRWAVAKLTNNKMLISHLFKIIKALKFLISMLLLVSHRGIENRSSSEKITLSDTPSFEK